MANKGGEDSSEKYNRRQFLGFLGLAPVVASVVAPLAGAASYTNPPQSLSAPPKPMVLAGLEELAPGSVKNFVYNNSSAVIIKKGVNEYTAFYRKCTHLGCTVQWDAGQNLFICPCHGGKFDSNGHRVAGPPPGPLVALEVATVDGRIEVREKGV